MSEPQLARALANRQAAVEERLEQACRRSGRARRDITLVAVTKTIPTELAALLPGLGLLDLGENRPQELWRKAAALPPGVRWHLIGHLQRNKIERTLPLIHRIHAIDSLRLLEGLEEAKAERPIDVLLEINASGEPSKQGFRPEEVPGLASVIAGMKQVRVGGLMTMAAFEEEPARCRPTFVLLRQLRDRLQAALGPEPRLEHLSMGMSNDFEVAVEEGATLVRLGTVLFEGLPEGGRVMIAITDHAEGLVLPVRAQPGARRNGVQGEQAGMLKVAVTAPPEDGRANQALVELLREVLGVKRSQVELLGGQTSREKRFLIRGLTRAELEARVAVLLS